MGNLISMVHNEEAYTSRSYCRRKVLLFLSSFISYGTSMLVIKGGYRLLPLVNSQVTLQNPHPYLPPHSKNGKGCQNKQSCAIPLGVFLKLLGSPKGQLTPVWESLLYLP